MEKIKILIIEDEVIIAEKIKALLEKNDYQIMDILVSAEEVFKVIKNNKPDLIIMDIMLKGKLDGIEAATEIRQNYDIPVIYLTAYADEKLLERAKMTSPFGYIEKPFREKDLGIVVKMALFKHKADKKIKVRESNLQNIFINSIDGIIVVNQEGEILAANPMAEKLFGKESGRLIGESFGYPIAVNQAVEIEIFKNRRVIGTGQMRVSETVWESRPAFLVMIHDISERKESEEKILNLAKFPDENPNPIMRISKEGLILYANQASNPLLNKWEYEGKGFSKSFKEEIRNIHTLKLYKEYFEEYEGRIYSLLYTPIQGTDYINVYGRDVTLEKQAEEEIRKLNRNLEKSVAERTLELRKSMTVLEIKNEELEKKNAIINEDLYLASLIQKTFLPGRMPEYPMIEIFTEYIPMIQVGGDYYDFFLPREKYRCFGVLITDVSGHGVSAAFITSMVRMAFQSGEVRVNADNPALVLSLINKVVFDKIASNFITAFYCYFDLETMKLKASCAGHNPIYILNRESGSIEELHPRGKILGLIKDTDYEEIEREILSGTRYFFYTDGLTEAADKKEVMFEEKLMVIFNNKYHLELNDFCHTIIHQLKEHALYQGKESLDDDMAMVVVEVK